MCRQTIVIYVDLKRQWKNAAHLNNGQYKGQYINW
jgi:hypothetical protein